MTDREDRGFRRFPNPGWAWPSGPLDQLICAAIRRERDLALDAFRAWLASQNIEEVGFREHRLPASWSMPFIAYASNGAWPSILWWPTIR